MVLLMLAAAVVVVARARARARARVCVCVCVGGWVVRAPGGGAAADRAGTDGTELLQTKRGFKGARLSCAHNAPIPARRSKPLLCTRR